MSDSAMSTPPDASGKLIDLVNLVKGTQSNDTSKIQASPRQDLAALKAPKTPSVRLIFPHGFTSTEEEVGWKHELDFGFGNIWTEYDCMHSCAKYSRNGGDGRGNGNISADVGSKSDKYTCVKEII